MLVLLQPLQHRLVPRHSGRFSEAPHAPEIARKGGGEFRRRLAVCGASAASSALAGDFAKVNPQRVPRFPRG